MSIPRLRDCGLIWCLLVPCVALAAAGSETAERERIVRERATVERESRAAQAACATQFAVTACIDRAKAERRQRLQVLDRQRAVLDDELRRRHAAERVEQIRQRQAASADERPKVTVRTRSPASSAPAATAAAVPKRSAEATLAARQGAASQADGLAQQRASAAQRRAAEAAAHRLEVETRNSERARLRPAAQPLPPPPAASQAR